MCGSRVPTPAMGKRRVVSNAALDRLAEYFLVRARSSKVLRVGPGMRIRASGNSSDGQYGVGRHNIQLVERGWGVSCREARRARAGSAVAGSALGFAMPDHGRFVFLRMEDGRARIV